MKFLLTAGRPTSTTTATPQIKALLLDKAKNDLADATRRGD
jgi:hypothetical protein